MAMLHMGNTRCGLGGEIRNRNRKGVVAMVGACLLIGGIHAAMAQEGLGIRNSTALGGSALSHISGVSTTNMAAGEGNLQSNSGAIAIGKVANTASTLLQQARIDERIAAQQDRVGIKDRAFRQAEGWMSINQAAGQGNVQSNTFGVALGISASNLSDTTLQQVLADKQGLSGTGDSASNSSSKVEIDKTTFEGARGVIQVNQSAGTGNATRNSFRMNMALGQ
ncbi:hypothetical protein [Halomonas ventosae]|uniref:Uncharacterized protein n=1 Tax=Halomonas ventosae TaxID=229007 RepID=A0A2T0VQA5_9GAMM|nr:hypothetical protein [Halomonas ventosae]PRY72626.1 hypothetical protein BCL64_103105 [Halomonas ventosae]